MDLVYWAGFVTRIVVTLMLTRTLFNPMLEMREVKKAVKIGEHRLKIRKAFAAGYRYRLLEEQQK